MHVCVYVVKVLCVDVLLTTAVVVVCVPQRRNLGCHHRIENSRRLGELLVFQSFPDVRSSICMHSPHEAVLRGVSAKMLSVLLPLMLFPSPQA